MRKGEEMKHQLDMFRITTALNVAILELAEESFTGAISPALNAIRNCQKQLAELAKSIDKEKALAADHEHAWEPWHQDITGPRWTRICSICGFSDDCDEPPDEIYSLTLFASTGKREYKLLPKDHPAYKPHARG